MTDKPRDDQTRRFQSDLGRHTPWREARTDSSTIERAEISFLAEGLAYGPRALRAATRKVTERHDLGPRGAWMMTVIAHGVTYPLELAAIFGVGRSLVTAELARLSEAGLIATQPSSTDRRKTELTLTPLGREADREVREEFIAIVRTRLAGFDAAELRIASEVLRALSYADDGTREK